MDDSKDNEDGGENTKSFLWEVPVLPLLERSCSDCGGRSSAGVVGGDLAEAGKSFRRVLSETWNYPSWLFVESPANSSSDDVGSDPDLDCGEDEIEVTEDCTENNCVEHEDSSDSEDEGWYSLSRTDVRKLQDVRNTSEHVNIILTNPDILHLPQTSIFISQSGICCEEEDQRNEESSPERTSYSSLSSGDSGQLSDSSKSSGTVQLSDSRKTSDSGQHSDSRKSSEISHLSDSRSSPEACSDISCDSEDSGAHKITVYVKYSGHESENQLVEGCVDSEGEAEQDNPARVESQLRDVPDSDSITICDTRVRLRLCATKKKPCPSQQLIPVKRKDLFKLLGLNESSHIVDPSEEADAKKVALQNFLSSADKNDNTSKKNSILLAPKQGRKNLAKFLGIDMSALADDEALVHSGMERSVPLDCESVSISSSTASSGKKPTGARHILGKALPGIRSHSRGASCEKTPMEDIPEQLRTPKVPQANRKDLQRFLGLNDCEEMVYIRNVRKPQRNESHQTRNGSHHGGNGPPQRLHHSDPSSWSPKCDCGPENDLRGTISSICSCVVCSNEYSAENNEMSAMAATNQKPLNNDPGNQEQSSSRNRKIIVNSSQQMRPECEGNCPESEPCLRCQKLVQHNCGNEKCIMCTTLNRRKNTSEESEKEISSEIPADAAEDDSRNINNNIKNGDANSLHPPPLPKKTVAPYQEYKFGLEEPMPIVDKSGKEKRRKKNATKRMEQIIKIHTENGNGEEPESNSSHLKIMRTLDRSEPRQRRFHKRSILKQHSKDCDRPDNYLDMAKVNIRNNQKVKFAGSLRKREQVKLHRRKILGHPCQAGHPTCWH